MERFFKIRCIGHGTFGQAFLAHDNESNQQVVLKDVKVALLGSKLRDNALNEVKVLQSLRHPYIVRYHDAFVEASTLHIAMEYCANGDLHHRIEDQRKNGMLFPESRILAWMTQLLLALDYLHSCKILHRDLKTQVALQGPIVICCSPKKSFARMCLFLVENMSSWGILECRTVWNQQNNLLIRSSERKTLELSSS